jgi:hypothetical protein
MLQKILCNHPQKVSARSREHGCPRVHLWIETPALLILASRIVLQRIKGTNREI